MSRHTEPCDSNCFAFAQYGPNSIARPLVLASWQQWKSLRARGPVCLRENILSLGPVVQTFFLVSFQFRCKSQVTRYKSLHVRRFSWIALQTHLMFFFCRKHIKALSRHLRMTLPSSRTPNSSCTRRPASLQSTPQSWGWTSTGERARSWRWTLPAQPPSHLRARH